MTLWKIERKAMKVMNNYNELMKKLDEYGGAMVFLNDFREILSKYNLTPELIANILERGVHYEHIQPRSNVH